MQIDSVLFVETAPGSYYKNCGSWGHCGAPPANKGVFGTETWGTGGIMNVAPCFNPDCEGSLILPPPSLKLESHCNFASFLLNIYKICILGGVRGRHKCIVIFAEVVLN